MNLGAIWSKLDDTDRRIMCQAICHYGTINPNSYCGRNMWLISVVDHSRLLFFDMVHVYHALQSYTRYRLPPSYYESRKKIDRLNELIRHIIFVEDVIS